MKPMAAGLSDADIEAVAIYLTGRQPASPARPPILRPVRTRATSAWRRRLERLEHRPA